MQNQPYVFDVTLSTESNTHTVEVDTNSMYGYTENNLSGCGGGLWFEKVEGQPGVLSLTDYDGVAVLPKKVIRALRGAGFIVDENFE